MFQAWDSFGEFHELIDLLRSNYAYWQGQQRLRESSVTSTTSTASAPAVIQSTTSGAAVYANASVPDVTGTGDTSAGNTIQDEIDGVRERRPLSHGKSEEGTSGGSVVKKLSKSSAASDAHPLSGEKVEKVEKVLNRTLDSASEQMQGIKESNVSNISQCTSRSSSSPLPHNVKCYKSTVDDINDIQCITDTIDTMCNESSTCKLLSDSSDITHSSRRLQSNNIISVSSKAVASDSDEAR